jgi:hypothetical protein
MRPARDFTYPAVGLERIPPTGHVISSNYAQFEVRPWPTCTATLASRYLQKALPSLFASVVTSNLPGLSTVVLTLAKKNGLSEEPPHALQYTQL